VLFSAKVNMFHLIPPLNAGAASLTKFNDSTTPEHHTNRQLSIFVEYSDKKTTISRNFTYY